MKLSEIFTLINFNAVSIKSRLNSAPLLSSQLLFCFDKKEVEQKKSSPMKQVNIYVRFDSYKYISW